jgi:hypothetical protein
MVTILERRQVRSTEREKQQRQKDIRKYHNRLQLSSKRDVAHIPVLSAVKKPLTPPLSEFQRWPVIQAIQAKDTPSVAKELKNSSTVKDIQSAQRRWETATRERFNTILGHPRWRDPSNKVIHLLDRVTARFVCKRCKSVSREYAEQASMDFVGACTHECPGLSKRGRNKRAWSPDIFSPDNKVRCMQFATINVNHILLIGHSYHWASSEARGGWYRDWRGRGTAGGDRLSVVVQVLPCAYHLTFQPTGS